MIAGENWDAAPAPSPPPQDSQLGELPPFAFWDKAEESSVIQVSY